MTTNASPKPRYALSFTTGTLLRPKQRRGPDLPARARLAGTRTRVKDDNLLQSRVARSNTRMLGALIPRLQVLTNSELEIVADGTSTERGHLMWAAACRQYALIGEFAEEVLRERFLMLAGTLTYEQYDSFYRGKAMWHDELGEVTENSYKSFVRCYSRCWSRRPC